MNLTILPPSPSLLQDYLDWTILRFSGFFGDFLTLFLLALPAKTIFFAEQRRPKKTDFCLLCDYHVCELHCNIRPSLIMYMGHFNLVDWGDSEDMEDEKEMNARDEEEDDDEEEKDGEGDEEEDEKDMNAKDVVEEEIPITLPLSQWPSATECDDPSPRS